MAELRRLGCDAFLEIGPQPVLVKMGRRCVAEEKSVTVESLQWLASLQPGRHLAAEPYEIGPLKALKELICQRIRSRAAGDEVESMLICSRALGVAFSRPSELQNEVALPWRQPMLHPLRPSFTRSALLFGPKVGPTGGRAPLREQRSGHGPRWPAVSLPMT